MKRRELLGRASALGAALLGGQRAFAQGAPPPGETAARDPRPAASDRIRVGFIGVGSFGTVNLRDFLANADAEVVAICDVFKDNLEKAVSLAGGKARTYHDYRRLLDDREVDAVVISTPEHWHANMCIDACDAGKDVYVEKPASHHIRDGRLMVEAARRKNRVVQVGSQQRSGAHFQRAVRYVQDGRIGDVHYATCWQHSPRSVPRPKVNGGPPPGMDWEMWLGPAAKLPYDEVMNGGRHRYWEFFGGNLTEWGAHLADIVLWAMKVTGPETVVAAGGRFHRKEGEIPDTLQVTYKYPTLPVSLLDPSPQQLRAERRPGGRALRQLRDPVSRDQGHALHRPGWLPHHPPDRSPGRAQPTSAVAHHRQPAARFLLHHGDPARGFGQLAAARATRAQLPRLRQEPQAAQRRHRGGPRRQHRLPAGQHRLPGGAPAAVGRRKEEIVGDAQANRLAVGSYRAPWKPRGI